MSKNSDVKPAPGNEKPNNGIRAILDKALQSYEKLPMLEVVFDRFVRILSGTLRNFTSETVDIEIQSISSLRFGSYIDVIPLPSILMIFKAIEWENFGLVMIDSALVYSLVDVLLGGRKVDKTLKIEGRSYTTIEQSIVRQLGELLLSDLGASFDPVSPTTFQYERIETNPSFATIARPGEASILLQLKIEMEKRGGKIDILIPYATLEPIRKLLLQVFIGEKFGRDAEWEGKLRDEVFDLPVTVEAVLNQKPALLKDIMNLKVGSTIIMENHYEDEIMVHSGGVKLLSGKLGKVKDKISVQVINILQDLNKKD
jgi:flagellar motor switch protein FliM